MHNGWCWEGPWRHGGNQGKTGAYKKFSISDLEFCAVLTSNVACNKKFSDKFTKEQTTDLKVNPFCVSSISS